MKYTSILLILFACNPLRSERMVARFMYGASYASLYACAASVKLSLFTAQLAIVGSALCGGSFYVAKSQASFIPLFQCPDKSFFDHTFAFTAAIYLSTFYNSKYCWDKITERHIPNAANAMYDIGMNFPLI